MSQSLRQSPADAEFDRHHARLERGLAAFQAATGLTCPASCGVCCQRTRLTVTDLEARAIWDYAGPAPDLLAAIADAIAGAAGPDAEGCYRCPLYQIGGRAGCPVYPARPTLCRLFGFQLSLRRGAPQLNTCQTLAEQRLTSLDDALADRLQRAAIRHLGANPQDVLIVKQLDRRAGGDGQARPILEALRRTAPAELSNHGRQA